MGRALLRVLLYLMVIVASDGAWAAKRVAFVVGNDAYANVEPLQKAISDARAIGGTLQRIGFAVILAPDVDRRTFNQKLQEFASAIEPGDEALFFYAGHGVEIDGRNFLLPTDVPPARPGEEEFVKGEAVAVDRVLDIMRERRPRISIMVLDACRNNPFKRDGTRGLGGTRGLAAAATAEGTFILYSAGVGQTALDRLSDNDSNPNSVFTRTLVPLLGEQGLPLPQLARRLRSDVQKLAHTVSHDQRPAYYDEIVGEFSFRPATSAAPAPAPVVQGQDDTLWSAIEDSTEAADFEFYLRQFPAGKFAAVAKLKLDKLNRGATDSTPPSRTQAALPSRDIVGRYLVQGTNPDGSKYRGQAEIWRDASQYRMRWRIGKQTYEGKGTLTGDVLTIDWGQSHPVIYKVGANGVLNGVWANGSGTEDLSPAK